MFQQLASVDRHQCFLGFLRVLCGWYCDLSTGVSFGSNDLPRISTTSQDNPRWCRASLKCIGTAKAENHPSTCCFCDWMEAPRGTLDTRIPVFCDPDRSKLSPNVRSYARHTTTIFHLPNSKNWLPWIDISDLLVFLRVLCGWYCDQSTRISFCSYGLPRISTTSQYSPLWCRASLKCIGEAKAENHLSTGCFFAVRDINGQIVPMWEAPQSFQWVSVCFISTAQARNIARGYLEVRNMHIGLVRNESEQFFLRLDQNNGQIVPMWGPQLFQWASVCFKSTTRARTVALNNLEVRNVHIGVVRNESERFFLC